LYYFPEALVIAATDRHRPQIFRIGRRRNTRGGKVVPKKPSKLPLGKLIRWLHAEVYKRTADTLSERRRGGVDLFDKSRPVDERDLDLVQVLDLNRDPGENPVNLLIAKSDHSRLLAMLTERENAFLSLLQDGRTADCAATQMGISDSRKRGLLHDINKKILLVAST
jgi:hypothetical protein